MAGTPTESLARDGRNITICQGRGTDAQALSISRASRIDTTGQIDALLIDGEWVSVESPMFGDHVTHAVEAYEHPWLYDHEGNYIG